MAQVSEPRTTAPAAQANIQDAFLNFARRDRLVVVVCLMDGRRFEARIKNFDKFAVIVDVNGADQLIFKHAISTIETERSVANYLST
jgi:host factor-I protein